MRIFKRRRKFEFIFEDEDGNRLSVYGVRAGMLIVRTDYDHDRRRMLIRLSPEATRESPQRDPNAR